MTQPQAQSNQASAADTSANAPVRQPATMPASARDLDASSGNPLRLMRRLSEDLDELFGQVFGTGLVTGMPAALVPPVDFVPAVETFERDGKLVVRADLPGLSPQDVAVEVANGVLTLSGERQEKREVAENGMRHAELRYGRFMRSIRLPEGTRATDILANFSNGVLEITVSIPDETQASRKIEVQGSQPDGQSAAAA